MTLLVDQLRYSVQDLWRVRVVFVFTFLFPLTWLVLIGFLAGNDAVDPSGVRVMQFVTPTAAVMGVLFATFPTVATSLAQAREHGILKRIRGTPVPASVYLAGRLGGAVVFAVGSVLTMLAVGVLVYDVRILWRTAVATIVTLLVGIASLAALGLAVAMLAPSSAIAQAASIASAVVLSFLSGLYIVGDLPSWADRIAAVFPLKPFNDALRHQFNPFHDGGGWDAGALLLMFAWGLAGVLLAARAFRWGPAAGRTKSPRSREEGRRLPGQRTRPVRVTGAPKPTVPGRPNSARLLLDQVVWATRGAWRDLGWVFFAVAMPVGLFALTMTVSPASLTGPDGMSLSVYVAAGMTAWGAAVTSFVNMPEAVALARDRGVLKRLRGTPLSPGLYLAGRAVSAVWIALFTGVLVLGVGVTFFDLRTSLAGAVRAGAVVVVGTVTLAACGFALAAVLRNSKAMTAVGLAILLPVSFFSDVFGMTDPPEWMSTVGSFLPLKHVANSLSAALDPSGPAVSGTAVVVLLAWLVGASAFAMRAFAWDAAACSRT